MTDKIGVLDPMGQNPNPLTGKSYSPTYRKLGAIWSIYPAFLKADEVLSSIKVNNLILIISATGSGKTVLIPKFALHYLGYSGRIAITLPKRNVTLSAATFAAKTLDVDLGRDVGYVYKGSDKKMIKHENKLIYMTDGTLIMEFVKDPLLTKYDIIIIDEAHERSIRIDLLLLFIKNILKSGKRPELKVIIMSATIDADKYIKYFVGIRTDVIRISGQPMHQIDVHFLNEPIKSYMDTGLEIIQNLISKPVKQDMLFFITTSKEAFDLCAKIRPRYPRVYCIELYADAYKDQTLKNYIESRDAYLELGDYNQKLVMATNVAESSVTIDGLKCVIDSAHELYSYFDPASVASILEKRTITKAQALQRRGRVGRTEPGTCYHLLTKTEFDKLREYPEPEILKQDITQDMLKVIQLTENKTYQEAHNMMNELMDAPKKPYTDLAYDLYKLYNIIDQSGKLTKIGYDITNFSAIPINRSLFLVYSFQMHVAREASIILAMLDRLDGKIQNLFYKNDTICKSDCAKPAAINMIKSLASRKGDHLTFLNVYRKYNTEPDPVSWARKYGIKSDILKFVDRESKRYYYNMVDLSKAPQLSRSQNVDIDRRIIQALKLSHKHLTAHNLKSVYASKKTEAKVSRDSVLNYYYNAKKLAKKTFIFDEMVSVNGKWEFSTVTII